MKELFLFGSRETDAGVANGKLECRRASHLVSGSNIWANRAFRCEFDRVAEQVIEHLSNAAGIADKVLEKSKISLITVRRLVEEALISSA